MHQQRTFIEINVKCCTIVQVYIDQTKYIKLWVTAVPQNLLPIHCLFEEDASILYLKDSTMIDFRIVSKSPDALF